MGLYGSEYWTYVLPRRVGRDEAERLTGSAEPIGAQQAAQLGVVDRVLSGTRDEFDRAVTAYAQQLATSSAITRLIETKEILRQADEAVHPLEGYRVAELARMRDDIFFDAHGFTGRRRAFLAKQPVPAAAPPVRWDDPKPGGRASTCRRGWPRRAPHGPNRLAGPAGDPRNTSERCGQPGPAGRCGGLSPGRPGAAPSTVPAGRPDASGHGFPESF